MFFPFKTRLRSCWNDRLFPIDSPDYIAAGQSWPRRKLTMAWAALVAASLVVFLPNLGHPLIEPDETRYAQIAIEMNQSRDWITPTLGGKPYLDKPPLMYWVTAACFKLLGTNEVAARLPSVLSSLAMVFMTFLLGQRIVGQRSAWLGALLLILSGGFVLAGRFLILDSLLAFFTTMCLFSGYLALRESQHRWTWWMVSGVACALGVLTKGPVAFVLCAPPLIVSGWLRSDHSRTRPIHWLAFVIPMILICVPWYLAVWTFNPEFGDYFFLKHNLQRFTQGSNHQQPFWFYLPVTLAAMFPASLLLPATAVFLFSGSKRKRMFRTKDLGFVFCGALWVFLFFSISSCKLPTYILPGIPLLCLMIGVMLDHTVLFAEMPSRIATFLKPFPRRAMIACSTAWLIVVAIDVWLVGKMTLPTAIMVVCCVVVTVLTVRWRNRDAAESAIGWAFATVVAIAAVGSTSGHFLPTVAWERSVHVKAAMLAEQNPNSPIVFFGEKPYASEMQLPTDRVVFFPRELRSEFVGFMEQQQDLILVTGDEYAEKTRAAISGTHELFQAEDHEHLFLANRVRDESPQVASRHRGGHR